MILTVDIGNSNIVFTIFKNKELFKKWRIITDKNKSKDEYSMVIKQLMKTDEISSDEIEGIVISSVVPEITTIFKEALSFLNVKILVVGDKSVKTNLDMDPNILSEVGSDIMMNIVGGKKRFKENFVIIDMGTATTFDIALKDGYYVSSIITPGIAMFNHGLHNSCSQLPLVEVKRPDKFLGKNTSDAIKSGVYYGYIGMIKEIISNIKEEFKDINLKFYITGGLSVVFLRDLDVIDGIAPDLTCEGLQEVWYMNN